MQLLKRGRGRPRINPIPSTVLSSQTVTGIESHAGDVVLQSTPNTDKITHSTTICYSIVKARGGLSEMAEIYLRDGKVAEIKFSVEDLKPMIMAKIMDALNKLPEQPKP